MSETGHDGVHPVPEYAYIPTDETPEERAEREDREDGPSTITSTNPATLVAGGALPAQCDVFGTGFKDGAVVTWDGVDQASTWYGDTNVEFAPTIASPAQGTYSVQVRNPGGELSNAWPFTVTAA